jgi:rSAM/selenodomain-associated transferase 2
LERNAINTLSIIIPVYNEAAVIQRLLASADSLIQKASHKVELILVDGGSVDATKRLAEECLQEISFDWQIVDSSAGRAKQMNVGAGHAQGDTLLFLHADTQLPENAFSQINHAMQQGRFWGRFDVQFLELSARMKVVASMMNWRSRQFGIATGDQAIFMSKMLFDLVGGFDDIPLMEDVAMSKKLKIHCLPFCSRAKVKTSARRWLQNGWLKTVLLMWYLRLGYFLGVSPATLAKQYRQVR